MTKVTDELLMRYVDGELNTAEAAAVEKALAKDVQLREKLSRHHALNAELQLALKQVDETPMPEKIIDLLKEDSLCEAEEKEDNSNVVTFSSANTPSKNTWWRPAAMAASIAVAFLLGQGLNTSTDPANDGLFTANSQLISMLDKSPSGQTVNSLTIEASFKDAKGTLCRSFSETTNISLQKGLSCRGNDDVWQLAALAPKISTNAYFPASGETIDPIDLATAKMQKLSKEEEARILENN